MCVLLFLKLGLFILNIEYFIQIAFVHGHVSNEKKIMYIKLMFPQEVTSLKWLSRNIYFFRVSGRFIIISACHIIVLHSIVSRILKHVGSHVVNSLWHHSQVCPSYRRRKTKMKKNIRVTGMNMFPFSKRAITVYKYLLSLSTFMELRHLVVDLAELLLATRFYSLQLVLPLLDRLAQFVGIIC